MKNPLCWTTADAGQKVWLWIGLLFAAFYFGEAVLFWGPHPRVHAPRGTPLVYWGAFGAALIWILRRAHRKNPAPSDPRAPQGFQSVVLGVGITAAVIGLPFFVMMRTQDVTAGHVVLAIALAEAAVIIGGMSGSLGWLLAGAVWTAAGFLIHRFPSIQDWTLGAAVALGCVLIGLIRTSVTSRAAS